MNGGGVTPVQKLGLYWREISGYGTFNAVAVNGDGQCMDLYPGQGSTHGFWLRDEEGDNVQWIEWAATTEAIAQQFGTFRVDSDSTAIAVVDSITYTLANYHVSPDPQPFES